jgi:hypothetical protein
MGMGRWGWRESMNTMRRWRGFWMGREVILMMLVEWMECEQEMKVVERVKAEIQIRVWIFIHREP